MVYAILIIALIISLWKWWSYKCLSIGLIYFASIKHGWDIDEAEIEKILEYSIKKKYQRFFKN